MKHIRDAMEDWEYYQMAKAKQGKEVAISTLNQAFTDPDIDDAYWNLNMDHVNFLKTRESIAILITADGLEKAKPTPTINKIK